MVPGCLVLIGGDPGVGKSTIMLQIAAMIAHPEIDFDEISNPGGSSSSRGGASEGTQSQHGYDVGGQGRGSAVGQEGENGNGGGLMHYDESRTVLYISGEENEEQVRLRQGSLEGNSHI